MTHIHNDTMQCSQLTLPSSTEETMWASKVSQQRALLAWARCDGCDALVLYTREMKFPDQQTVPGCCLPLPTSYMFHLVSIAPFDLDMIPAVSDKTPVTKQISYQWRYRTQLYGAICFIKELIRLHFSLSASAGLNYHSYLLAALRGKLDPDHSLMDWNQH